MHRQRIAIIIPGGVGTGKGNIGVPVLENVIERLTADFQVTVFQLYPTNEGYRPRGFELIVVYSTNRLARLWKFIRTFSRVVRQRNFDVVHGYWALPCGFLATVVGKVFHVKSCISLQGGDAISIREIGYGQMQNFVARRLILWALHRTDVLISPTRYLIDNLRKFGLTRSEIRYLPLGVDVTVFQFRSKPLSTPVRFLHVANLNPVKDQATLLKAFKLISGEVDCHLTIIGEGHLEEHIRDLTRQFSLDEKVTFLGLQPHDALPAHFERADILLHTSLSEGHPIVVEEAMSCGVLLCGTRVGLLYDLPKCCVSVEVGDYESLARKTLDLIADRERQETLRAEALGWAKKHSIDWTVRQIQEVYSRRK